MTDLLSPFPRENHDSKAPASSPDVPDDSKQDNITFFNFNPEENRRVALRSIGKFTMSMAVKHGRHDGSSHEFTADYGEILSSEPMAMEEDIERGTVDVSFLQYWRGYRGDDMGSPHMGYKRPDDENKSLETIRIVTMHYNPLPKEKGAFVTGSYLPPRIHKHKLLDYQARLRSEKGRSDIAEIRKGLWGPEE